MAKPKTHIDAMDMWQSKKPRYNPYQTGHGVVKSKKAYTRKSKHQNREEW